MIDFFPVRPYLTNELVPTPHDRTELTFRGRYRHLSLHGGEDYREWLVRLPNYYQSYFGPHFTERNVLLHMRTKTRVDWQGRKLLFIEEIQSDWLNIVAEKIRCVQLSNHQRPLFRRAGSVWV